MGEASETNWILNGAVIALAGTAAAVTGLALYARHKLKPKIHWSSPKTLDGLTIVVTGGNSGIGAATVTDLARRNANVIIASRTASSSNELIDEIKKKYPNSHVSFEHLDLSSLASAKEFVQNLSAPNVDILVNNAGVWGSPVPKSADGIETTFAVNYLGPFYLTKLMFEKYKMERVINVSSGLYTRGQIDPDNLEILLEAPENPDKDKYREMYSTSKLGNIYFTLQLAEEHPETCALALHPGLCYTSLARYVAPKSKIAKFLGKLLPLIIRTPEEGAMTVEYCCVEDGLLSGSYFGDCQREELKPVATDQTTQSKLWEFSEQVLKRFGY